MPNGSRGMAVHPRDRETAMQAGGDVVGGSLEGGGQGEDAIVRQPLCALLGEFTRGNDAADDRRRRRAQASRVRDAVDTVHGQARRLTAEDVEGRAHRTYDQMILVAGDIVRAFTRHLNLEPAASRAASELVVTGQRQPEGVEAGAEIRAGRRYPKPHRVTAESSHPNDLRAGRLLGRPGRRWGACQPRTLPSVWWMESTSTVTWAGSGRGTPAGPRAPALSP